jgi:hypothetical protein
LIGSVLAAWFLVVMDAEKSQRASGALAGLFGCEAFQISNWV